MTRERGSRACRRFLVALLAVWMVVFAVVTAAHNHGLPEPISKRTALNRPVAEAAQGSTCFACLASRVPVSAPEEPIALPAPCPTAEAPLAQPLDAARHGSIRALSSRAPPSFPVAA